jgi:flagellar FliL protein
MKLIIIIVVVLLRGGGGAAWFLMKGDAKEGEEHSESKKSDVAKDPKFIPLEVFTVNLQHEESADQFLQISMALKVMEPELEEKVKAVLPEIRSKLNLLLSGKKASELVTLAGKKKLAHDIVVAANSVLGIHNEPEHAAAPKVAEANGEAAGENGANAEAAPVPAPPAEGGTGEAAPAGDVAANPEGAGEPAAPVEKSEKKGVVDVMFTSFIIQ